MPTWTNLAAVNHIRCIDAYLMQGWSNQSCPSADESINLGGTQSNQVMLQVVVSLLGKFGRFFKEFRLCDREAGLLFPQVIEEFSSDRSSSGLWFSRAVSSRQIYLD